MVCYGAHDRQPCAPKSTGSQGRTHAGNGLKAPLQKARRPIADHKGRGCTREHYAEKLGSFHRYCLRRFATEPRTDNRVPAESTGSQGRMPKPVTDWRHPC